MHSSFHALKRVRVTECMCACVLEFVLVCLREFVRACVHVCVSVSVCG